MIYPKGIEKNCIIGVTAPSAGLNKESDYIKLNNVEKNFKKLGYRYIETESVRKCENGRSTNAKNRAKEFMGLWQNEEVEAIIMATGGDFLFEILEYLDFDKIKKQEPKWIQGYSDISTLTFIITTMLDIATIYGPNVKAFGMKNLYKNLTDSIEIMKGKEIIQESFEKCEDINLNFSSESEEIKDEDILKGYELTKENTWKVINKKYENIKFSGRTIGGCFDIIVNLIGTQYDKIKEYIEKYKNDGIIWFFDIYEMSSVQIYIHLWQMKNAGYFEYCKGILFGRPLFVREDYDMKYFGAISKALESLNIPIIYDADIGHVAPQMPIVNGGILEVNCNIKNGGKVTVKNIFN